LTSPLAPFSALENFDVDFIATPAPREAADIGLERHYILSSRVIEDFVPRGHDVTRPEHSQDSRNTRRPLPIAVQLGATFVVPGNVGSSSNEFFVWLSVIGVYSINHKYRD